MHRIQSVGSPVWSCCSLWGFGVLWHLLVLVLVCPLWCQVQSQHGHLPGDFEHFMLPSADGVYGDAEPDWPASSPDQNPTEYLLCCQEEDEKRQTMNPNTQTRWRASVTCQQSHKMITPMPGCIHAVFHNKGTPTRYKNILFEIFMV